MNEKIKELAKQAGWGKGQSYDDCIQCSPFNPEEFAESIIKECINVADDYVKDCSCEDHIKCNKPRSIIGIKIKEHFGIE
jgi:hypothetical protein